MTQLAKTKTRNNIKKQAKCTILIIKHGALGDFFESLPIFYSIRHHFPNAYIALLTTSVFLPLAKKIPWFDDIFIDNREHFLKLSQYFLLYKIFKKFSYIYDFQNSNRTFLYQRILNFIRLISHQKQQKWNSAYPQSFWQHKNPYHKKMHISLRQEEQLKAAFIPYYRTPQLDWIQKERIIPSSYIILVPGASAHRPEKKWPIDKYKKLLSYFKNKHKVIVVIGTINEYHDALILTKEAERLHLSFYNYIGKTSLYKLISIIANADYIIGNDTGPMHIAASLDRPSLTLFSDKSDPRLCAPISKSANHSHILYHKDLRNLSTKIVINKIEECFL